MTAVAPPVWPIERAGEALATVGAAAGLAPRALEVGDAPAEVGALGPWLEEAGGWLGIEVEAVTATYNDIDRALVLAAPALLAIPDDAGKPAGVLAVIRAGRGRIVALGLDLRPVTLAVSDVRAALCQKRVAPHVIEVGAILDRAGVHGRMRTRATDAMIASRLRGLPIEGIYLVRRPPETSPRALAREYRLVSRLAVVLALHALGQVLWLASWWAIGRSVLGGTLSSGWLAAWGLLLASSQAAQLVVTWASGKVAIDTGALLSQRLLAGALRTDPDRLRRDGVGVAFGRVLESNAVHQLAVTGGLRALLAVVQLVLAGAVLAVGAGGALHVIMLAIVTGVAVLWVRAYLAARRACTRQRFALTHSLVESMVGHSTRLAQGDLTALADKDDRALVRYLAATRAADHAVWRLGRLGAGWALVAAAGLTPALIVGTNAGALAIAIGGMIFASQAISELADGAARVADAVIAWESVSALVAAAEVPPDVAPPALALASPSPDTPALVARGIGYRHAGRGAPVLADCDLVVARGEYLLLKGTSGAGKSTLAAILAGLRKPESGLVLIGGLDRTSVGARGWRRRIACAPQFHDNHVFGTSLAFNLLMGRSWPPSPDDLDAAAALCRDLGLGPLIKRMPGGLFQQVGETGWQLSHGERSRMFLARALLQSSDVLLLDESLAALDPENLAIAIRCIEARAPTAIVIAHP